MESLFVKNEGSYLLDAILPLLKLLCLTVFGLILAHPKTKIVPKSTFKLLSKLVFALFLPCTIFINLGETITLKNFTLWWFIPVSVILSTAVGCLLGYFVAKICKTPPEYFRFTVIATGFGNTGNLPLAIVGSVCHSDDNFFGPDCESTGVSYVSFAQWVAVILVYTLVYHMMEPPVDYFDVVEDGNIEILEQLPPVNDLSRPLLVEAEWPGMEEKETEHCKTPFIARTFASGSSLFQNLAHELEFVEDLASKSPTSVRCLAEGLATRPSSVESSSVESIRCLAEPQVMRKIRVVAERTPIRHILQPPTFATLLAFIIGMVPPLKSIVFGYDAPLSFLTDSLEMMAQAMVPSVMLILGGMLAEGPNESRLGIKTTVGIIVARLLVLPLVGIGVVGLADKMNILIPDDQMYRFVLLLQYTTPSAILLGAVARLRGYAVSEASALLFWQHVLALFSLSIINIYDHLLQTTIFLCLRICIC